MSFASGTYNGNATAKTLANAINDDASVKAQVWARYLDLASRQHNAFSQFESDQPKRAFNSTGQRGIFAKKRDLNAAGGDTVHFTVMSAPAGPGVIGEAELTGNTSSPTFKTYSCKVDYKRDAVELTKKMIKMMAGGQEVEQAVADMLTFKMGMWKQNDQMMSLLNFGSGNTFRANNRATTNDLVATDVLTPSMAAEAKARLNTLGAIPISQKMDASGDLLAGYLVFASEYAMLNVRNTDGYINALNQAGIRGDANPQFTGKLPDWQGLKWYEHIITDQDWDDYIGSPIQPKMKVAVAVDKDQLVVRSSATNTKSRYAQFMGGYSYPFTDGTTDGVDKIAVDAGPHYGWACNPDGSRCFVSCAGSGNDGNLITINAILSSADATTGANDATVGVLSYGSGSTVSSNVITLGTTGRTVPTGFVYKNKIDAGAILIKTNSAGVAIGRGFVFGSYAMVTAYGGTELTQIKQDRDYGFVTGAGFETITGQYPCVNVNGITNGYLNLEYAIEHPGYDLPVKIAAV